VPDGGLDRALAIAAAMLGDEPARAFGGSRQDADVPVAHGCRGSCGDGGTGSVASTAIGSSGCGSLNSKSRYPSAARADGTDWSA
jgi:hypothetical protein